MSATDEPFIEQVNGKDFVVLPYTLRNNDILTTEGQNYAPALGHAVSFGVSF